MSHSRGPTGSVVFWGLLATHLSGGAALTWQRTRLPFMTSALALGAIGSALLAGLAVAGR